MTYRQDAVTELADTLKTYGFRVFLSDRDTHGFYTDESGTKVVSFEFMILSFSFGGNYYSQSCGAGWSLDRDCGIPTKEQAQSMLDAMPPYWATKGEQVTVKTLTDHLKDYQKSSRYREI